MIMETDQLLVGLAMKTLLKMDKFVKNSPYLNVPKKPLMEL